MWILYVIIGIIVVVIGIPLFKCLVGVATYKANPKIAGAGLLDGHLSRIGINPKLIPDNALLEISELANKIAEVSTMCDKRKWKINEFATCIEIYAWRIHEWLYSRNNPSVEKDPTIGEILAKYGVIPSLTNEEKSM